MLKSPGTKSLKPKYDKPLSICLNFAFKFNLRRYNEEVVDVSDSEKLDVSSSFYGMDAYTAGAYTRPLFSST